MYCAKRKCLRKTPKSSILQKEIDDWKVKVENHKYVPRISNRGLAKIYANRKYKIYTSYVKLDRVSFDKIFYFLSGKTNFQQP